MFRFSPSVFFISLLCVTAMVWTLHRVMRHAHKKKLRELAGQWGMQYAQADLFNLASRVASDFPIPGVADLLVRDMIYATQGDRHRYIFTAEYTLGVIDRHSREARQVAYADMTGSGNETYAHLAENGRITLMFCGFEERPKIVRIYGRGRTVLRGDADWTNLAAPFEESVGLRQIILVDVNRVASSCGFGVPMMKFVDERGLLQEWAAKKGKDGLEAYRREKNVRSIDGLILPLAPDDGKV